jgi:hypothetical protein
MINGCKKKKKTIGLACKPKPEAWCRRFLPIIASVWSDSIED